VLSVTTPTPAATSVGHAYFKETLIKGRPGKLECFDILGQTYQIKRGPLMVVGLEDSWYEDQRNPEAVLDALRSHPELHPDIFTFWQRPPDLEPKYPYHVEWEALAVLPIRGYEHWWNHQIKSRVRNQIRKAAKEGVRVEETTYDDAFVRGMTAIFNESAVRQGRRFWHYGKDFETVKRQFSRFIHREQMIGAYYQNEMIGLVMLGDAGRFGVTGQIISSLKHRDKATNNALMAKVVEVCERRQLEQLVYLYWSDDTLAEFKRRCGFEKTRVPRYFVPLTAKGKLALKCGAHRGWKQIAPAAVKTPLRRLRQMWHGLVEE
jgi:hypothetical protein